MAYQDYLISSNIPDIGSYECIWFNDKIWIIGGKDGSGNFLDTVYSSSDMGKTFSLVTDSPGWAGRSWPILCVFDDKLWVMAGNISITTPKSSDEVWYSSDGTTWTLATSSPGWSGRHAGEACVFDGKMWVTGGLDSDAGAYKNDVWYTTDGTNWTQATASASWSARQQLGFKSFNGKIWVFSGYDVTGGVSDVWYSSDGASWTQATSDIGFDGGGRYGQMLQFVFDDKLWAGSGVIHGTPDVYYADLYYSSDGVTWTKLSDTPSWSPREYARDVVEEGGSRVFLIGGYNASGNSTEIWRILVDTSFTPIII